MKKKSSRKGSKKILKQNKNISKTGVKGILKDLAKMGLIGVGSAIGGYMGGPSGATWGVVPGQWSAKLSAQATIQLEATRLC